MEKIEVYCPEFEKEIEFRASFLSFIKSNKNCFERSLQVGHITGSSWIVNQDYCKALLTHHKKLNRWLQLGGHADGEPDIVRVATNEAIEESGLSSLRLYSSNIFDIDIHTIPARNLEPEHLHYDVRFLFTADDQEPLQVSEESKDLAWVHMSDLVDITESNASISRMAEKAMSLFAGNKK